ncbi:MAG: hypothetical protein M1827_003767 [Pycnora praestabilis]|nr:MAG: hypothetical protein M1827_003767 [Pycnora praestabilis]
MLRRVAPMLYINLLLFCWSGLSLATDNPSPPVQRICAPTTVDIIVYPVHINTQILSNTEIKIDDGYTITVNNAPTNLVINTTSTVTKTQVNTNLNTTSTSASSTPTPTVSQFAISFSPSGQGLGKRQSASSGSGYVGSNGTTTNSSCETYAIIDGQLFANNLLYSTSPGVEYAQFIPSATPGNITTTFFVYPDNALGWSNPQFFNGGAQFCYVGDVIYAVFGSTGGPSGCIYVDLNTVSLNTACAVSSSALSLATGPAGPQGSMGPTGPVGPQGSTGPSGATGLPGPSGPSGATGLPGPSGPSGISGSAGPSGPSGPSGTQGISGPSGSAGPSGPSGPSGTQGIPGPSGSAGPQGSTGAQGIQGATGLTGTQGIQGAAGLTGAQGIQGAAGLTGATGATGAQGIQGSAGLTGATGATGAQGIQGSAGLTGATGATGAQGIQGSAGLTGTSGATGAQGPQGLQGAVGLTGATGAAGSAGPADFSFSGCYISTGTPTLNIGRALAVFNSTYTTASDQTCSNDCVGAGYGFFGTVNSLTAGSTDCYCGNGVAIVNSAAGTASGLVSILSCAACANGSGECGNNLLTMAVYARNF